MTYRTKYRKPIAAFLLTLVVTQLLAPVTASALTSGPAQPESTSFAPAGTTEMVDLFTGDFKYNLPLMDVDGYPVNLSYQSGSGIDDEASWTGLGWNLNVGSITRQLRGIPDDLCGNQFETEHYTKPKITVGARFTAKGEFFGLGKTLKLSGSLTRGVFSDNYTGIGAELGANAGISYTFGQKGIMTAGMGIDLLSSTATGVTVTPNLSLAAHKHMTENGVAQAGLSASLGYNSRAGLKELSLGATYTPKPKSKAIDGYGGITISYNTEPVSPDIQVPYKSFSGSFSTDVGPAAYGLFVGGGQTGYMNIRQVKSRKLSNPAFGFLYAEKGMDNPDAMMDFIREKENIVVPEMPNIAIPVGTPDLFAYTSQGGSGQFRLYRGGTGIFFDNEAIDENHTNSIGFDLGQGHIAHMGVTLFNQDLTTETRKWKTYNDFAVNGDFQGLSKDPEAEPVYFKQVGEKSQENALLAEKLGQTEPVAVALNEGKAVSQWTTAGEGISIGAAIKREKKERRTTAISYLTAEEAARSGLDKAIYSFAPINYDKAVTFNARTVDWSATLVSRTGNGLPEIPGGQPLAYRDKNHISEITVTDESGKRSIYGIPVYNAYQKEYSYAIGNPASNYNGQQGSGDISRNLIRQSDNGTDIQQSKSTENDNYLHTEKQPGYATSFLLTGIVSPDYVDVTNNGISDDDQGTAIKFNYSQLPYLYQWRSPYGIGGANKATINRGLLADPDDDKASFVHGAKELWFLHSIETKTQIAFFITKDRDDALGVSNWAASSPGGLPQKMLCEIRLFSKADLTTPIKVVKFNYDYLLCKKVPNHNISGAGKLTLTSVTFEYGTSSKGANHPYVFHYNNDGTGQADQPYEMLQTDRWGSFKPTDANAKNGFPGLRNDEFPYATTDDADADKWAGTWQLSRIELPTGGEINVTYESDDYGYVQNRTAMRMTDKFKLITKTGAETSSLKEARGVRITDVSPNGIPKEAFIEKYLNGSPYLYTKFKVNVSGFEDKDEEQYYDFIPCYAKIQSVEKEGNEFIVLFEEIKDGGVTMNPIWHAAVQKMRLEYPRYSYPGYRNRIRDKAIEKSVEAAVAAIVNAGKLLNELVGNFYDRAADKGFADKFDKSQSMIRIAEIDGFKNGGGNRVKRITISDNWATMTSDNENLTGIYGQEYDYTTKNGMGEPVSSGVASYEPSIGNDENPMRLPVPYVQNIKGALNNFFTLEEPFGESFFPAPSVGYSRVTVRDIGEGGVVDASKKTGTIVHEFYTAKQFPAITKMLPNKIYQRGPSGWYSLFGANASHTMVCSQGYAIELNDMHGKPKASRVFNQSGAEISSTEYYYNAEPLTAGEFRLKNVVDVVNENGEIEEAKVMGRDIEVFTDMRHQESSSLGETVQTGGDVFEIAGLPLGMGHWPLKVNDEFNLFRSASTMKVVQYYGILEKVVKMENGSTIATENVAYDAVTGQALITKTTNEFEDPVYSINFPAYWMYPGMKGAYNAIGTIMPGFTTTPGGAINISAYNAFLHSGDELIPLSGAAARNRYWVIETLDNSGLVTKKIVDENGKVVPAINNETMKVVRSGYRNMLTPAAANMVCLRNPVSEDRNANGNRYIVFSKHEDLTAWKVLTASAVRFDENWATAPQCPTCPTGYAYRDGNCELLPNKNTNYSFAICRGSQPSNTYGIHGAAIFNPSTGVSTDITTTFWGGTCNTANNSFVQTTQSDSGSLKTTIGQPTNEDSTKIADTTGNSRAVSTMAGPGDGKCGRLVETGIWLCAQDQENPGEDEWMSFEFCVNIPAAGNYFLGYACDNKMNIKIDGVLFSPTLDVANASNYEYWHVRQYNFSKAGQHTITLTVDNYGNNEPTNQASVGMEIYQTSYEELIGGAAVPEQKIIFSTRRDLLNNPDVQVRRFIVGGVSTPLYTCPNGEVYSPCIKCGQIKLDGVVNPYVKGVKGNWRPMESKVLQVNRANSDLFNDNKRGVEVRNGGTLVKFKPYWTRANTATSWSPDNSSKDWVTANTVTLYDKYGQELENKDALGRYSAAGFVFKGEVPGAVASNARNREIVFETFEDAFFNKPDPSGTIKESCNLVAFRRPGVLDYTSSLSGKAHTGRYALDLAQGGLELRTMAHKVESKTLPYTTLNDKGEFVMFPQATVYPVGFEPVPGQNYVFSAWVREENQPNKASASPITVKVNSTIITLKRKAYVEKWSLMEGVFGFDLGTTSCVIEIGQAPVVVDDIRIHPVESHMKTYAYDSRNLRLMAELDENNFASFYEYDNEGGLVRVKKETERGIMTIKETRSSQKKHP